MKCLLPILPIGLLLFFFTCCVTPEDDMIKLCDPNYAMKLSGLCHKLKVVESSQDFIQGTEGDDYFNEILLHQNSQRTLDRNRLQQSEQEPDVDEYDQNEQFVDYFNTDHALNERDVQMKHVVPKEFIPNKLSKRVSFIQICCERGCTRKQFINELCFWVE